MQQAKLYDFNVIDKIIETDEPYTDNKQFTIQAFAKHENGETTLFHINDFHPFFYVKIPDDWASMMKRKVVNKFKKEMGSYYEHSIIEHECTLERHKKLYGFDGGQLYKFIKLVFKNTRALYRAKNVFYHKQCKLCGEWSPGNHKECLHPGNIKGKCYCKEFPVRKQLDKGYRWGKTDNYLVSYEANIPPLLRFFHINNLSPSGWCQFNLDLMEEVEPKTSLCDYEYQCSYQHIVPIEKETMVPYKIMSFDIEADSSHGDFPLAIKSYKKLAMQIVDSVHKNTEYTKDNIVEYLTNCIYVAFGYCKGLESLEYTIDKVYLDKPELHPSKEDLDLLITNWLETDIPKGVSLKDKSREADEIEDDDDDEHTNTTVFSRPKSKVVELLLNNRIHRNTKVLGLENSFWQEEESRKGARQLFPKLKGDIITFIGSTFMKYGDEQPYRNHCLALGECSPVEGADIVSCNTEAEVLIEWAKIVQEEDPDFIIGYNIFGFDYDYIFKRAKECGKKCVTELVKVSKIMDDDAVIKPWANPYDKSKKPTYKHWRLKENVTRLASGDHELSYFLMSGRIQVDLLNLFRREHNLTSYKLDYVSGHFIGDYVKKIEMDESKSGNMNDNTKIYSQNLNGLEVDCFIHFEEIGHSTEYYNGGSKHRVMSICKDGTFIIEGTVNPDFNKKIRWCLAKDDVTPQDIFRLGRGSPNDKAIVAKYCIQDCNLVHQLMRKLDIITGFIEMAKICYVPMNFLVLRGQGIKLTSFIAQKCREKGTLMPDIQKDESHDGYEGAIVLDPKTGLYTDDPVACVDYSSLYPSSMISENLCHSSKVWTREYDVEDNLIHETGVKNDITGDFKYDNLEGYKYVDITYDTYTYRRKTPKAAAEKIKIGYKTCRFAQYPDDQKAIMPSVLSELLKNRSATKKLMKKETDPFMKNVLDKRQLSIKLTANSLYGQCGAKTSTFYEKDVAASTTATGRKLLTYAKRVVEEVYGDRQCETKNHGPVLTKAEYVYGDTDSIFFTFHLTTLKGEKIIGKKALEITIELAQEVGHLATQFLKDPHDLEYEKTFKPFALLSKKRYVGILYEDDVNKGKRKEMGIVLKRRDNAPIVKDVYGGVIDILMKGGTVQEAIDFTQSQLQLLVDGKIPIEKLIITKSLRSHYKNPAQIAHRVLADRIGRRDPGNKPRSGDRIAYAYIKNPDKKALQGDRIETPEYIKANNLELDYSHYITNQIMKPLLQLFGLILKDIPAFKKNILQKRKFEKELERFKKELAPDKFLKKREQLENKMIQALIFENYIKK